MEVTILIAFIAGVISFLSPCILPIIPGFMSYIVGSDITNTSRKDVFLSSVLFVLGFSLVFSIIGVLLSTIFSKTPYNIMVWLSRIGGVIIIIFALQMLGIFKLGFLMRQKELKLKKTNSKKINSFILGVAFALGWTPCIGAILGSIFTIAVTMPYLAFYLLLAYSIGLGLPFLVIGLFTKEFMSLIKNSKNLLKYFNLITGILLLILGILMLTNTLSQVSVFLYTF